MTKMVFILCKFTEQTYFDNILKQNLEKLHLLELKIEEKSVMGEEWQESS